MYKCLLENDMHVVIGNFRNNRKNVSVQGKENLIEKKVLICCIKERGQETFL